MKSSPRYHEMASDDECAYISSDDEEQHELEIKPPQAKVFKRSHSRRSDKHSRSTSNRHVYVSNPRHHHKSHHSHHHQEDRYPKERFEPAPPPPPPRSHVKEYEERVRKKTYHHNRSEERFKEQDLREKLDRRKRHHPKEYDLKEEESRKERSRKERHRHEVKERRNHDELRRHHRDERKRARTPEEKSVTDESISPVHVKNMVIEIETSPPVLRGEEYSDHEPEEEEEEEEEEETEKQEEPEEGEMEEESENSDSSSSDSSGSNNSSSESSEESGSSESSSSSGEVPNENDAEANNDVSGNTSKEDTSPMVATNDNDGVDSEIELEKDTLPSYFPAIQGCRSVEEFQCLNRIEEGTYGVVYRAREKRTDRIVALKRLKMEKEKNGFPITSLREINTLLKAQHPNIVTVKEIVVGSNMDKIFIVMDYVEHDLKSLMETMKQKKKSFTSSEVKCLMMQLLRAVNHLHNNWILHRDLKTSNLLFSHAGVLKVGDFGLAREYGSPLKHYTPIVVTLWYRAPELLLGTKEYSTSVDVWSVGCIFAELLCMEPLFPGKTEPDQLKRIFKALGTPNEKMWPEYPKLPVVLKTNLPEFPPHGIRPKFVPSILSDVGYNLLTSLLCYNPKKRITADVALDHNYFSEHPLPIDPAMFSTWPAKSEHGRKATASSPKPPSGGQNYKELRDDDGFYIGVGERGNHPAGFAVESTFSLKF